MQRNPISILILATGFAVQTWAAGSVLSQEPASGTDPLSPNRAQELAEKLPPWPDLTLPSTEDVGELVEFLSSTKKLQPVTTQQFLEMQTAIRESARKILTMEKDRESERYRLAEFDFISSSVNMLSNEGPEAQEKTFVRFRDYMQQKEKLNANDLSMALIAAQNLEATNNLEQAIAAYEAFAEIVDAKKDPGMAGYVTIMKANIKRLNLPGKELSLESESVVGEPFDVKEFRGKYVLINVWSTVAPACAAEYPYLRKVYETYRERGFEIVGIAIEQEKETALKFIRENEVPWVNLWEPGGTHSFATEYGIVAIPTMILLDREGKVISLEARGIILGNALSKLLGPANAETVQGNAND